ncbi:hypothetical protein LSH36_1153g00060 [Paralvinella palmiformis]|uniref:Uncharacterized protein n=1 Tax=Paralvinella palmiformis TaxID=53620 RepID=A0AAD9IUE1_9ANNE|nr:hypothetical protein LSH36_1153g00060 [Paralvinella palmiformis]
MELDTRVRSKVASTGQVTVEIPTQLLVHCGRPRDSRANWECFLRFSSWTYDNDELDLQLVGEKRADMTNYDDRVWLIAGNTAWTANSTREHHKEIGYSIKILRR